MPVVRSRGYPAKVPAFSRMPPQTNTPQNLHGDFTQRFLLAVTLRSKGELRVAEVCVILELLPPSRLVLDCQKWTQILCADALCRPETKILRSKHNAVGE